MNPIKQFEQERSARISSYDQKKALKASAAKFMKESIKTLYSYNFSWLGRPIIQYPQDIIGMQEIIWKVKPDLIIETGIAHGGSIIFYASILELIGKGKVIGIDLDIRKHNYHAIKAHPMIRRIVMIEGSSTAESTLSRVKKLSKHKKSIIVVLDSNHTYDHVSKELEFYSPFVTRGSYLVVFDTVVEDLPDSFFKDRPWGKGNNPKTAVQEFLKKNDRFEIDSEIENKLLVTVAPNGFLRCIRD